MSKADFNFDVDDLERLLPQTKVRRGRGRKCSLTQWLELHRERFGRLIAREAHTWEQLALTLTQLGLTNGDGKPLNGERVRKSWVQVRRTQAIQSPRRDEVTAAISPLVRKAPHLARTDSQGTTTDPRFISLLAELDKVEATGDITLLFQANRLEHQLKKLQREHEGGDNCESVTQFVGECIRRLSVAREDYRPRNQLEEVPGPPPERSSQAAGSVPPNRPIPKLDVPKQFRWHTNEEYEALLVRIDWDKAELRCAELARKLQSSSSSTEAFQVRQELLGKLNAPCRMLGSESTALGRIPEEIKSLSEQPDGSDKQEQLAGIRIRQEVLQNRADKRREFSEKWMARLDEIYDLLKFD